MEILFGYLHYLPRLHHHSPIRITNISIYAPPPTSALFPFQKHIYCPKPPLPPIIVPYFFQILHCIMLPPIICHCTYTTYIILIFPPPYVDIYFCAAASCICFPLSPHLPYQCPLHHIYCYSFLADVFFINIHILTFSA